MGIFRRKPPTLTTSDWQRKQDLAAPSRYYGDGGTIHGSHTIDIQINEHGNVVAVWFRCQELPFRVSFIDERGRPEPTGYGSTDDLPLITGVEVLDR